MKRSSIRTRLALTVVAAMALIAAAAAALSWTFAREDIRADVARHQATLVAGMAGKIESDVATAMKTVSGIAESIPAAALDKPAEIENLFRHLPSPLGWIGRCAVAAPDGRILAHNLPAPSGAIASLAGRDYFRRVLAEKKPVVSPPLISGVSGAPAIALSVPRLDKDGELRLVVTCGLLLTPQGIFGHLREARLGSSGYLHLATREGLAIMQPDGLGATVGGAAELSDPLTRRAAGGFEGAFEDFDGQGRLALFSVKQIPSLGWFVAAVLPADEAYQSLVRASLRILQVTFAALILGGGLAWLTAGMLVAPLARLTRHLGLLRQRPEVSPAALPAGDDEIGELAGTFKDLLEDLRQREDTLRESEEKFARAFHSNPHLIVITRQRDGLIVEANEGFEHLTGYAIAEAVGKSTLEDLGLWAVPGDREQMVRQLRETGMVHDLATVLVHKDGGRRDVMLSAAAIELAGEPHVIGIVYDVTDLRRSQEALRRSEERFKAFFRNNPDYSTVSRLSDGKYIDVNRAFEEMTGWSREEVVGRTAKEIGLYADPQERDLLVRQLTTFGLARDFELHFRMRSGEVRLMQAAVVKVDFEGEPHIIGIARDITEVRRVEASRAKSEEKFSKAFHASPDSIAISRQKDGLIIDINEGFEQLTGYGAHEVIGSRMVGELDIWVDPRRREEFVSTLHTHGRVSDFHHEIRRKGGEIRQGVVSAVVIELGGEPCMISIVRDITEQVRADASRAKSEEKFSKAFHASPDWITIIRQEDGLIIDANEGFERLSGYRAGEAIGRTVEELAIWADPERRKAFVGMLRAQGRLDGYAFEIRRKGGEIRQCTVSAVPIEIGGEACMISIVRDVTEQQRAEAEIRRLNADLEGRVRARTADLEEAVRELESFSYSISHDLRSPLRAIAGYAKIIEEDHAARIDGEGRRLLGRIVGGAIRMSELIDDLLDFSRIGRAELKKVPIDMAGLQHEVLGEMPEAGSSRHLQMRVGDLPQAVADRGLMRQVWANLLSNAIKYSRQKDAVIIEVGGAVEGAELHYFVRDNGIGFDMAYADKLFQVFQRLHRDTAYEGTGVGLAIVARIVQRHGGRVWAEAEPGQGATFHFTLPAAPR